MYTSLVTPSSSKLLRSFIQANDGDAYYLTRACQYSDETHEFLVLLLLKRNSGWRYEGKVHEYLTSTPEKHEQARNPRLPVRIYQDREADLETSRPRFVRDLTILKEEYTTNRTPRTVFYLARTHHCLEQLDEAYRYYEERVFMDEKEGDWEEAYHSAYQCGELAEDWVDKRKWYMTAWELGHRVEPLLRMFEHYRTKKDVFSMYMMAQTASLLEYPQDNYMFVDRNAYEHLRWHYLALCSFYCLRWQEGENAAPSLA